LSNLDIEQKVVADYIEGKWARRIYAGNAFFIHECNSYNEHTHATFTDNSNNIILTVPLFNLKNGVNVPNNAKKMYVHVTEPPEDAAHYFDNSGNRFHIDFVDPCRVDLKVYQIPRIPECSDGIDNNDNTKFDFCLSDNSNWDTCDLGCISPRDDSEDKCDYPNIFTEETEVNEFKISGGLIKVSYFDPDVSAPSNRIKKHLTGIKGTINIYDGIYVPENAQEIKINLEFKSDKEIFFKIGENEIYRGKSNNNERVQVNIELENDDLTNFIGNSVPIRIGTDGLDYNEQDAKILEQEDKIIEFQNNPNNDGSIWEIIRINEGGFTSTTGNSGVYKENHKEFELVTWNTGNTGNKPKIIARLKNLKLSDYSKWNLKFKLKVQPQGDICGDLFKVNMYNGYSIEFDHVLDSWDQNVHSGNVDSRDSDSGISLIKGNEANHIISANAKICTGELWKDVEIIFDKRNVIVYFQGNKVFEREIYLEQDHPNYDNLEFVAYYKNGRTTQAIKELEFTGTKMSEVSILYPESYIEITTSGNNEELSNRFVEDFNLRANVDANVRAINLIINSGFKWLSKVILDENIIYEIDESADLYQTGEPLSIRIERELLTEDNIFTFEFISKDKSVDTISPTNINSIIEYNANNIISRSSCDSTLVGACESSEGCIWKFSDINGLQEIRIPQDYAGDKECVYNGGIDQTSSLRNAFSQTLNELDSDKDGVIDEPFILGNLDINTVHQSYPNFARHELQIRRWY
jgi:hypothetical protein